MRSWGRVRDTGGNPVWVKVQTLPNGDNSQVFLLGLIQCIKLNLNESPMFGDWGIPGYPAQHSQIAPDYYVQLMQQRWAPYFASLVITKVGENPPTYNIDLITKQGATLSMEIPT